MNARAQLAYTFSVEPLIMVRHEVSDLLMLHWHELCADPEQAKLDPDWDTYFALEAANQLEVFVARDSTARIIGYACFFVRPHIHYKGFVVAMNDVIFVHPNYRKGKFGIEFLRFCHEMLMARRDVNKIAWHVKQSLNWGPILTRLLKYKHEESIYTMTVS